MPRYLFNPATNYSTSGGGGVTPILLGGTGATTAAAAATNLGFVKTSDVGAANGVASLDASSKLVASLDWAKISSGKPTTLVGYGITDGVATTLVGAANGVASLDSGTKVPMAQIPSGLGTSITGPTNVYVSQVVNYSINDFSNFATYTITTVGGTFTRTNELITFTVTASAGGAASITVNGATFTLTVLAAGVAAPSVTFPANAATNTSLVPTFTSSAFAYLGAVQTQDSVQWDLATNSNFATIVQTYTGASNLVSWTPTTLSLNSTYYVRVRHHSAAGGWSAWSTVVSFSTIANFGWAAKVTSNSGADQLQDVAIDASGNIYAVGWYTGGAGIEAFISKWDASGNITWQRILGNGTSAGIYLYGVVTDSSGNIYAVGCEAISGSGGINPFITKYDASGNLTWQRKIGDSDTQRFYAVVCDSSGNIYAVGHQNAPGSSYALITKWDSSGNLTWQRRIGGVNNDYFYGVTIDTSGNIYAVGSESSSTTNTEAFITKWDSTGALTWQRKIGGSNSDFFYGVACDTSGNIYAVGYEISTGVGYDSIITKWDASGNLTWQRKIGASGGDYFYGVECDTSGNIYAVGSGVDSIITKWNASGNLTWQRSIGSTSTNDFFQGVACDNSGNIYAVGSESGGSTQDFLITKWNTSVAGLPNGALVNIPTLSIATPTLTVATDTLTASTTTLTSATSTLTVATTNISSSPISFARTFSSF